MVRMRMIDTNNIPRSVFELALRPELVQRIHEIPVPRAFLVEVFTSTERVHGVVLVFVCRADHEAATLIWVRCFRELVNLT